MSWRTHWKMRWHSKSSRSPEALAELSFEAADVFAGMLTAYRQNTALPSTRPKSCSMIREISVQPQCGSRARRKSNVAQLRCCKSPARAASDRIRKRSANAEQESASRIFTKSHTSISCARCRLRRGRWSLTRWEPSREVLGVRPEAGSAENTKRIDLLVSSSSRQNNRGSVPDSVCYFGSRTISKGTFLTAPKSEPLNGQASPPNAGS